MTTSSNSLRAIIGTVLVRGAVPLWVLAGAVFKLIERTPSNLPSLIVKTAKDSGIPLDELLRTLIGLEFLAVGVMMLVPRFARAMAIFMLTSFCLILVGEMIARSGSCGCFGSVKIEPWQMLIADGSLLAAVLIFSLGKRTAVAGKSLAKPALAMVGLAVLGLGISFAVPAKEARVQQVERPVGSAPSDPTVNPNPMPIPNSWYAKQPVSTWIGKPWREIELFKLMPMWPKDMDTGRRYVVFYSRTCDHCELMFIEDLIVPLDSPVTAVEIPQSKTVMTSPDAWEMPMTDCEMLQLPLGCDYIISSPLALTIVDGLIDCANEGEHKGCFGLQ